MSALAPQVRRWTREEYRKMVEYRLFAPEERVELIEGEVVEMSPKRSPHSTATTLVGDALRLAFGRGHTVRIQEPLALSPTSEPEPDVAVVKGTPRDYRDEHPSTALLIVEVSESSLPYDRTTKASLYAKSSIPEYWVVNLLDDQLEIHRGPSPRVDQPFGYGYTTVFVYGASDVVSPLAAPDRPIAVADLLP
ncbi:MAG: Uma2 family endonuclease [Candidatus Latescibacteria bacterium]|nr:Uma2 family endonuclease [Candidatus Latescibacterota bacterium]